MYHQGYVNGARKPIIVDFIAINLIVAALLIFCFLSTLPATHETLALLGVTASILLIGGLTLAATLTRLSFGYHLKGPLAVEAVSKWTLVSIGAIMIVNLTTNIGKTFLLEGVQPISGRLFAVLIGVSEEMFFRVFLCSWLSIIMGNLGGCLASSGAWTVYHLAVYQTAPSALLIIFLSGIVLGYAFLVSRRASVPLLSHSIVNFLATGG